MHRGGRLWTLAERETALPGVRVGPDKAEVSGSSPLRPTPKMRLTSLNAGSKCFVDPARHTRIPLGTLSDSPQFRRVQLKHVVRALRFRSQENVQTVDRRVRPIFEEAAGPVNLRREISAQRLCIAPQHSCILIDAGPDRRCPWQPDLRAPVSCGGASRCVEGEAVRRALGRRWQRFRSTWDAAGCVCCLSTTAVSTIGGERFVALAGSERLDW